MAESGKTFSSKMCIYITTTISTMELCRMADPTKKIKLLNSLDNNEVYPHMQQTCVYYIIASFVHSWNTLKRKNRQR